MLFLVNTQTTNFITMFLCRAGHYFNPFFTELTKLADYSSNCYHTNRAITKLQRKQLADITDPTESAELTNYIKASRDNRADKCKT